MPVQTDVRAEKEEYNSYLMDNVHTNYSRSPLRNAGYLFHRNVLQYIQQMIPELLYGRNQHPFVGRVHTLQGRSEGNHVQCRVFVKEQSAFQTCMDSFYLGIYTEQTFVGINSHFQDF